MKLRQKLTALALSLGSIPTCILDLSTPETPRAVFLYGQPGTGKYIPQKTKTERDIESTITNGLGYHNTTHNNEQYFSEPTSEDLQAHLGRMELRTTENISEQSKLHLTDILYISPPISRDSNDGIAILKAYFDAFDGKIDLTSGCEKSAYSSCIGPGFAFTTQGSQHTDMNTYNNSIPKDDKTDNSKTE